MSWYFLYVATWSFLSITNNPCQRQDFSARVRASDVFFAEAVANWVMCIVEEPLLFVLLCQLVSMHRNLMESILMRNFVNCSVGIVIVFVTLLLMEFCCCTFDFKIFCWNFDFNACTVTISRLAIAACFRSRESRTVSAKVVSIRSIIWEALGSVDSSSERWLWAFRR